PGERILVAEGAEDLPVAEVPALLGGGDGVDVRVGRHGPGVHDVGPAVGVTLVMRGRHEGLGARVAAVGEPYAGEDLAVVLPRAGHRLGLPGPGGPGLHPL